MSRSAPLALYRNVRSDAFFAHLIQIQEPMAELPPWRQLRCEGKAAFGFDDMIIAANLVSALHLEARIADAPALSYLKIGGARLGRITIVAVDNDLVLLDSSLPLPPPAPSQRIYIIYNALEKTITMIPSHPPSQPLPDWPRRRISYSNSILISRPKDRLYAVLALATISSSFNSGQSHDVVYIWRSSSQQWDEIQTRFPTKFKGDNVANSYTAVVGFWSNDRIFWANLLRGVIYCSVDALLFDPASSGGGPQPVFGFIELPVGPPSPISHAMDLDSKMYRTMGCVRNSYTMFINIIGFIELRDFVDCEVEVWTISPEDDSKTWSKSVLSLGRLAEQDAFKKAGLPTNMAPMYPSLNNDEGHVLYLMLGEYAPCCLKHGNTKDRCVGYVATADKALYHLRISMPDGLLLGSACFSDQSSPSPDVILASTSMIQSKSRGRSATASMSTKEKRLKFEAA